MKYNTITKSILVIDDEISILNLLETAISRCGYNVDTATNGKAGIQKIENNEYSLIITDIKMPGISGDQVLDYLRNKIKKSTPIIGMSGTPWLLKQNDFDAILQKPCLMGEIIEVMNQWIKK